MLFNITMINSIKDILNFRHRPPVYLKWDWSKVATSEIIIKEMLTSQPLVFNHFKLVIDGHGTCYVNKNSITNDVFCFTAFRSDNIQNILANHPYKFDNLVCAGTDFPLSSFITHLQKIKHLFKMIYYEAKDIKCDWVATIPMGMIMAYMLRCGGDQILHHINKPKNKTKLISCAFGSKWPHLLNLIKDRELLQKFTQSSQFIDNMFCNPQDYFEKLSNYKFFACPLGGGIQTPKICESILCETVPVVTNHIAHRELRDIYNLPLLIVDKWEDLTEKLLNEAYESKFKYVDWQKEKLKFLVENFASLLK